MGVQQLRRSDNMPKHSAKRSTGDMISSVVFFCFGLWLVFQALGDQSSEFSFRTFGLSASGALCIIAAFRFVIADILVNLFRKKL
jgi:hypothetical protein